MPLPKYMQYTAALRPLSAYVALLREAIAHNDDNAIHDLLTYWAVNDHAAYRIQHANEINTWRDHHG